MCAMGMWLSEPIPSQDAYVLNKRRFRHRGQLCQTLYCWVCLLNLVKHYFGSCNWAGASDNLVFRDVELGY